MRGHLLLLTTASAWVLLSMLLGDLLRVWESPKPVRWHAIVPLAGAALVWAVFAREAER